MKNDSLRTLWAKTCLVVIVVLAIALSWSDYLDQASKNSVDGILVQAVSAYGVARIVNGTLSLLQSVEISVPVVGGAAISPLEVLSPWNDLIDRFSILMEIAIGSLVLQKIFIELVSTIWFQGIFAVSGVFFLLSLYRPALMRSSFWFKGFMTCLFIRYAILVVVLLNGMVDQGFMRAKTMQDIGNMTHISASLEDAGSTPEEISQRHAARQKIASIEQEKNKAIALRDDALRQEQEARRALDEQSASVNALRKAQAATAQWPVLTDSPEISQAERLKKEKQVAFDAARAALQEADAMIAGFDRQREQERQSLDGRATRLMKAIASGGRDMLDAVIDKMNAYIDSILRLMATFVLQTVLLPLLFFWSLRKMMQSVWQVDVYDSFRRHKQSS
jgi:hypothetical protein